MDIKTPKGQKSNKDEDVLIEAIKRDWWVDVIETPKDEPSKIDTMLIKDNVLIGITENKCRYNMYLENGYFHLPKAKNNIVDSWLVTYDKINAGRLLAGALCVPFYGFLYLVDNNKILWWEIADKNGKFTTEHITKNSVTQANINGGLVERENAYLSLNDAHELGEKPW